MGDNYKYITRIQEMEKVYLSLLQPVRSLIEKIEFNELSQKQIQDRKNKLLPKIETFVSYYLSDEWREDYEASHKGLIPPVYCVLDDVYAYELLDNIRDYFDLTPIDISNNISKEVITPNIIQPHITYGEKKIVDADNIIFDLGGVLMKHNTNRCRNNFREFMSDHDIYHILGLENPTQEGTLINAYNRGLRMEFFVQEILKHSKPGTPRWKVIYSWNSMHDDIPNEYWEQIKGLRQKGYRIYLLSNTNSWHWYDTELRYAQQINECFDDVFLSFEMHCAKPDEEIYKKVDVAIGADPGRTIFVDDSEINRKAAEKYVGWSSTCWNMESLLKEIELDELAEEIVTSFNNKKKNYQN